MKPAGPARWLVLALALLMAAAAWWVARPARETVRPDPRAQDAAGVVSEPDLRPPATDGPHETRSAVALFTDAASSTTAVPALPILSAEARLVEPDGTPIAGGTLERVGTDVLGTSGVDGYVALDWPGTSAVRQDFVAGAPGRVSRRVRVEGARFEPGERAFLGEIELGPAGVLSGSVADANGAAVAGATVYACAALDPGDADALRFARTYGYMLAPGLGDGVSPRTESDADGSFRLEGVPTMQVAVGAWLRTPAHAPLGDHGPGG
jgi:hypothetical protein